MTRVAQLYHQANLRQTEIAERLNLSQARVSRLLKEALDREVVRITVQVPVGVNADLEGELEARYGITEAVVTDSAAPAADGTVDEAQLMRDIGQAAAYHLETTLRPNDVVGVSAWSATLLATVSAMHPLPGPTRIRVVQLLGGVGNPNAAMHATELTRRFALTLRGQPVLLPAPGVVGSAEARKVLERDPNVQATMALFKSVTVALLGVGAIDPSPALAESGNVFTAREQSAVARAGGVGDVCLRFYNRQGQALGTAVDQRVIGMTLDQLRRVPRKVAIAGGPRKVEAIRAAMHGGLIDVLVTDRVTAETLTP